MSVTSYLTQVGMIQDTFEDFLCSSFVVTERVTGDVEDLGLITINNTSTTHWYLTNGFAWAKQYLGR